MEINSLRAAEAEAAPVSEVFGIECRHHYGITTHEQREGETVAETVYRLIRENWHAARADGGGLHDDDHTWRAVEGEGWSRIEIVKNERSSLFVIKPWWLPDGPGAHWFSQEYRVATRRVIDAEIAEKLQWAERHRQDALCEKPTKVGTKRAAKAWQRIDDYVREAQSIATRWPQYGGGERTGWQRRMHEQRAPTPNNNTTRGEGE